MKSNANLLNAGSLSLDEMQGLSKTAICAHNWKVLFSVKKIGRIVLIFWEPITQKEHDKLKQSGTYEVSYSPNFKSYFKQTQIEGSEYFIYNSDPYIITDDQEVYRCPFNTRYKPGNGSINNIQSRDTINTIFKDSKIHEIPKTKASKTI